MTVTKHQTSTQIKSIDVTTLKSLLEQEQIVLVDVREPGEYASEHIAGATLQPLSKFDPGALPKASKKRVILQCQSGQRSRQAAQKLVAAGATEVVELAGGLNAWKEAGFPTQCDRTAPISLMRQVQIVAGSLVFTGTVLGAFVSPWFLVLSGFVGAGLIFAGVSGTCSMALLLAKLPYNRRA